MPTPKDILAELWGMETLRAYKVNAALSSLGKTQCDTCAVHKPRKYFWTNTTCKACYVGARR